MEHSKLYHLSQYCFMNTNNGQLYLNGTLDFQENFQSLLDEDTLKLVLFFVKPIGLDTVLSNFPLEKQEKMRLLINELISKNILVNYEELTNANERIFNMLKILLRLSAHSQKQHAHEKLKHTNNFISEELASQKNRKVISSLTGKGLEIGGFVPCISDNVNCIKLDIKNDSLKEGLIKKDATDLSIFSDDEFDFIINSHVLEHLTNPIKALYEWKRVLSKGGFIYFIVPHVEFTNDHNRCATSLNHLIEDYNNDVSLYDTTHAKEVMKIDLWYAMENFLPLRSPYVHHHTWNMNSLIEFLTYLEFDIIEKWETAPYNIHALTRVK